MHRIALRGNDPDDRERVRALGFNPRVDKRTPDTWRYETLFRDFAQVAATRERLAEVFDLDLSYTARLLADRRAIAMRAASEVRPGMVMVGADGAPDVVTEVSEVPPTPFVHDLDIAGTHNFVAAGVVTHNSIYGWRGAEVGNILRFEQDFPGAQVIRLEKNYRSTQPILSAAGHLIAHNEGRMGKTLWTDVARGEPIRVRGLWDNDAEARFVGEEIEALQRDGHRLGEIAILVRTGAQTRAFEERFLTLGLPYRVVGGPRFYERQEIRDALAYLRLIQSPDDDLAFERIVNVPKRGLGNKALQTLHMAARNRGTSLMRAAMDVARTEELRPQARKSLRGLLESFARWRRLSQEAPHTDLAQTVLDESGYTDMWQQDKSAEAPGRLENLKELIQAMAEFDSLGGFLEHVSLVMETAEAENADMVTVMTLHGAKGLEFDTVFLAGWEEGLFPNQRAMDEHGVKGLEEERRLAYVGLTRARTRAIVTFCANRRMYGSFNAAIPSRFVDELPNEHVSVESDPGLYGSGFGSPRGAFGAGFDEPPSRWSPGMARARERQGSATKFIEGTAEVIDAAPGSFGAGDRVFHRKFGYGTVEKAEGERLTIAFDVAGTKKVMASFVVPPEQAE
jgi:DNA helicase-2/ATP-dependent DNA helicase PcrA